MSMVGSKMLRNPVHAPLPGMIANDTGGYAYKTSPLVDLGRYLILGTTKSTYYLNPETLVMRADDTILNALSVDPAGALELVAQISDGGRAPSNEPALYVLANALIHEDVKVRNMAGAAFGHVVRTGTHFLHLVGYIQMLNQGRKPSVWSGTRGRHIREIVGNWINSLGANNVLFQVLKYPSRDGMSWKDALRLVHVKPVGEHMPEVLGYAAGKIGAVELPLFERYVQVRTAKTIGDFGEINLADIPFEWLDTKWRNDKDVWLRLMPTLGVKAALWNVTNLAEKGFLNDRELAGALLVRITDVALAKRQRVHPVDFWKTYNVYKNGSRATKGGDTKYWEVSTGILNALERGIFNSFANVEPSGLRFLVGVDCSMSMQSGGVPGMDSVTPEVASMVLAKLFSGIEPTTTVVGFATRISDITGGLKNATSIAHVMSANARHGESTNLGLPIEFALKRDGPYDCIVIVTDGQDNTGEHPQILMEQYWKGRNPNCVLVHMQMTGGTMVTIGKEDPRVLNIPGFDTNVFQTIVELTKLIKKGEM